MKLNTASTGPLATKFFLHPLDPNMGVTFDGSIWTRYVHKRKAGAVGEWRELTKYQAEKTTVATKQQSVRTSGRTKANIGVPKAFLNNIGSKRRGWTLAGRFTLECYLGRQLESFEVCRHGIAGPNDHSYLNVSPGDAVNNMIDDLENGKSETSLSYLIQAKNRIDRLISGLTSTKPTN